MGTRTSPVVISLFFIALASGPAAADEPDGRLECLDEAGHDFIEQAQRIARAVACAGDAPVPPGLDAKVVDAHCQALRPRIEHYRSRYIGEAKSFISRLRPDGLPATVVYPFGGGDLISALTTYPDATDITTISLEHAGDPRRLDTIDAQRLRDSLAVFRRSVWGLLMADNSTTEAMQNLQRGEVPGQLAFFLVGLALHGYEPVSLRYFTVNPDGSLHYLSLEEITLQETTLAKTLRGAWQAPDLSVAFSNSELVFRPMGGGPTRVHRHFAADMGDPRLSEDDRVLKYLDTKGRVAALTKAASYLLWRKDFTLVRKYLLDNMEFMISDSTGIPPRYVEGSGFVYETYGTFTGSFLATNEDTKNNADLRRVYRAQPARQLPFRFGYPDANGKWHLFVLRKGDAGGAEL